jgi:WD40 repeat protein/serine/threonine protein kinase
MDARVDSGSGPYALLDQLAEEFAERYRRGERPSLREYTDRYPDLADEIQELFPALVEVEQVDDDRRVESIGLTSTLGPPPPRQFGDYRIVREVGRGGMGVVYEAEQVSLGRRVALKVLPTSTIQDGSKVERFRREARSAARLHHTNIVPVFEVGQDGDSLYYAMQFIQGQGLDLVIDELRRLRAGEAGNLGRRTRSRGDQKPPSDPATAGPRGADPASPPSESSKRISEAQLGGSELQARQLSRMAQSLLSGRIELPDPGASSDVDATEAITDRGDADVAPADGAASTAAQSSTASAVLPGGKALSTIESNGRLPFYRGVARIGQQAAQGLGYAHARGIVHRDIKPSNLLLDGAGVVWITDFGLAKAENDGLTRTGDILGTLRYMAPERFRGEGDARADVYALGLTLYEVLTLRPAFDSHDRLKLIEQIKAEEPRHPRAVDPRIPRDLETIVLKAIDKDSKRRYVTADQLAQDLQRFIEDRPVLARRSSLIERAWRTCKRNPLASSLAAALLLALAIGLAGVTTQWLRAEANAASARAQEAEAVRARNDAVLQRDQAWQASERLRTALDKIRGESYILDIREARRALEERNSSRVRELLDRQRPSPSEADLRGFEWSYLQRRAATYDDRRTLQGHRGAVQDVAFSPDRRLLASGSLDGTVRLWEVATGKELRTLTAESGAINCVAFCRDGGVLAAGSASGLVTLWDLATSLPTRTFAAHDILLDLAFSPDGRRLATAGQTVKLWDVEKPSTEHAPRELQAGQGVILAVAFSPDGRLVASSRNDGTAGTGGIEIWEADTGKRLRTIRSPSREPAMDFAFHPDGQRLAAAQLFEGVVMWDVKTGREAGRVEGHFGPVHHVAYSANGRVLASAGDDGQIWIWDAATNQKLRVLEGYVGSAGGLALDPTGASLAAASGTPTVLLWDLKSHATDATLEGHEGEVVFATYSPDGRVLASGGRDKVVRLWDVAARALRRTLRGHRDMVFAVAFSPDGSRLASASHDGTVILWDRKDGRALRTFAGHGGPVLGVAFHPDGRRIASAGGNNPPSGSIGDCSIRIWDTLTGKELLKLEGHTTQVRWVTFSPDGRWLASSGHYDGTVRVWDCETGQVLRALDTGTRGAGVLAFSPDGRALAAATQYGGTVKVWNAGDGSERVTLRGHSGSVWGVAFSPDGRRLASTGTDRSVRVWDAASGQELLRLDGHAGFTTSVAFRPDGLQLTSTSHDRTVRIWDADGSRYWDEQAAAMARRLKADPSQAQLAYDEVRESIPEVFERVASLCPSDGRLWVERARALIQQGRSDQADAAFTHAAAAAGGDLQVFLDAGWWVIGPYPSNLMASYPPESSPYPSQPVSGVQLTPRESPSVLRWQHLRTGLADFEDVLTPRTDAADISAYALAHVYTPAERAATLAIGGVNPMRAWLNERLIYEYDPALPSPQARDLVPVTLRAGRNTLLVKVATGDGPLKAYVRFVASTSDSKAEYAAGNRWSPVLSELEAAAAMAPNPSEYELGMVAARLALGDRAARTRALRDLIDRSDDTSDHRLIVACWICGMATDVDLDRERLVRVLQRFQDVNPSVFSQVPSYLLADPLGVALLRAGRYADAIRRLEAFDAARGKGSNASSLLYRALAHHCLGHAEDARRLVADAHAWLAEFRRDPLHLSWPLARRPSSADRLEWRLLLRETEELVGRAAPAVCSSACRYCRHDSPLRVAVNSGVMADSRRRASLLHRREEGVQSLR